MDISHNPKLRELRCWYNNLSELDLSNNPELQYLFCDDNRLISLSLDANTKLEYINCSGNRLTSLDLSDLQYLACLDCSGNLISVLDVSQNKMLGTGRWDAGRVGLYCANMAGPDGSNLLKTLYVSKDQVLPGVTSARDTEHVPSGTTIVVR